MFEILNFLKTYEYVIYFVFGIAAVLYVYRFVMAWNEIRSSVFGLELVSAQRKLNRSAMGLFVLLFFTIIVFVLITFVSPVVTPELSIPETDGSISSIATEQSETGGIVSTETSSVVVIPTVSITREGCIPGVIEITSPEIGETVRGVISISGTVNIDDFAHYVIQYADIERELWNTLGAGDYKVIDGILLESFDTSLVINPGVYVLQLIVDNLDRESSEPCRVPIVIVAPEE